MASYWVSFRVNDTEKKSTYDKRRQSIYDAANLMASCVWEETTSFIIFETDIDATKTVATRLTRGLLEDFDTVVVRKVDFQACYIWGLVNDKDIYRLMPTIKRLVG